MSHLGHLVVGRTTEDYRFEILDPAGPVRRIERKYEPVRLNREERAQWQALADYYSREPENFSAGVEVPPVKPALRNLEVDLDGRISIRPLSLISAVPVWFELTPSTQYSCDDLPRER